MHASSFLQASACPRGSFSRVDSLGGADTCACAAFGASFGVDGILVAFGDGANGAFINASTACDAVVTNYVSHVLRVFNIVSLLS